MIMIIDINKLTPADVNFLADTLHDAFYNAHCDKGGCPTCSHGEACYALYKLMQFWSHKADEVNYKKEEADHV